MTADDIAREQLRQVAGDYGLHIRDLNAICITTLGEPSYRITPAQVELVISIISGMGPEKARAWALELGGTPQ